MNNTADHIDTTTGIGFKKARVALGLSTKEVARILDTNERTVTRWEDDPERPVHPTAAAAMVWFLKGFRPPEWPADMTGPEMAEIREDLGMHRAALGVLLDVDDETIALWESDERGPPPVVRQVMRWLKAGFHPLSHGR